jgi:hypothetical protein
VSAPSPKPLPRKGESWRPWLTVRHRAPGALTRRAAGAAGRAPPPGAGDEDPGCGEA